MESFKKVNSLVRTFFWEKLTSSVENLLTCLQQKMFQWRHETWECLSLRELWLNHSLNPRDRLNKTIAFSTSCETSVTKWLIKKISKSFIIYPGCIMHETHEPDPFVFSTLASNVSPVLHRGYHPPQDEFGPLVWPFFPSSWILWVSDQLRSWSLFHPAHYAVSLHSSPSSTKS